MFRWDRGFRSLDPSRATKGGRTLERTRGKPQERRTFLRCGPGPRVKVTPREPERPKDNVQGVDLPREAAATEQRPRWRGSYATLPAG